MQMCLGWCAHALKVRAFYCMLYSYKINKTQTKCTPDLNIAHGDQLLITNETRYQRDNERSTFHKCTSAKP